MITQPFIKTSASIINWFNDYKGLSRESLATERQYQYLIEKAKQANRADLAKKLAQRKERQLKALKQTYKNAPKIKALLYGSAAGIGLGGGYLVYKEVKEEDK